MTSALDFINLTLFSSDTQLFYTTNTGVWFHKPNEWLLRERSSSLLAFFFFFFKPWTLAVREMTIQLLKTNKQSFYYCCWTSELTSLPCNQINHSDGSERRKCNSEHGWEAEDLPFQWQWGINSHFKTSSRSQHSVVLTKPLSKKTIVTRHVEVI